MEKAEYSGNGAAREGIVRNMKSMRERGVLTDGKPKKRTVQTCWNAS